MVSQKKNMYNITEFSSNLHKLKLQEKEKRYATQGPRLADVFGKWGRDNAASVIQGPSGPSGP